MPALNRHELTDHAGGFMLMNLPAGSVDLVVSCTGFNDERRSVTVSARWRSSLREWTAIVRRNKSS